LHQKQAKSENTMAFEKCGLGLKWSWN